MGELTNEDKARLLAVVDHRNIEDYDKDYYKELQKIEEPHVDDLDDRIRRAIGRYIHDIEVNFLGKEGYSPGAYLLQGWILGYLAATTIKRSIFKKERG